MYHAITKIFTDVEHRRKWYDCSTEGTCNAELLVLQAMCGKSENGKAEESHEELKLEHVAAGVAAAMLPLQLRRYALHKTNLGFLGGTKPSDACGEARGAPTESTH